MSIHQEKKMSDLSAAMPTNQIPALDNGTNTNNELYLSAGLYNAALDVAIVEIMKAYDQMGGEMPCGSAQALKQRLLEDGAKLRKQRAERNMEASSVEVKAHG